METKNENNEIMEAPVAEVVAYPPKKKGNKAVIIIAAILAAVILVAVAVVVYLNMPSTIYKKADNYLQQGDYLNAMTYFAEVQDYQDAEAKRRTACLKAAEELVVAKSYDEALAMLDLVGVPSMCNDVYLLAANQLTVEKKYDEALDMLDKVGVPAKRNDVYLLAGKQMIADEAYTEAVTMLEKADTEEAATYATYATAMLNLGKGAYDEAISAFSGLGEFENSAEKLNEAYYGKAEKLFKADAYSEAKTIYQKTTGYSDTKEKINNCDLMLAEDAYKDGDLKRAKQLFEALPSNLSYKGVSASARLETLKKNADKVELCGTWSGKNGNMTVRQTHTSTGIWDQWDCEYTDTLTLKVVINSDGTFTFKGTAKYYIYTNYSSLSRYLTSTEMVETFSVTGKSIPKTVSSDSLVKLTYSDGAFTLKFTLTDKNSSMNFDYKYTSTITYKK